MNKTQKRILKFLKYWYFMSSEELEKLKNANSNNEFFKTQSLCTKSMGIINKDTVLKELKLNIKDNDNNIRYLLAKKYIEIADVDKNYILNNLERVYYNIIITDKGIDAIAPIWKRHESAVIGVIGILIGVILGWWLNNCSAKQNQVVQNPHSVIVDKLKH